MPWVASLSVGRNADLGPTLQIGCAGTDLALNVGLLAVLVVFVRVYPREPS